MNLELTSRQALRGEKRAWAWPSEEDLKCDQPWRILAVIMARWPVRYLVVHSVGMRGRCMDMLLAAMCPVALPSRSIVWLLGK